MDEAFERMQSAAEESIEVRVLVSAVTESLQLIEPWNTAKSNASEYVAIIAGLQQQGNQYYRALRLSTKTADDGYQFCTDAEHLCGFLLDPEIEPEELLKYVAEMKEITGRAHSDALHVFAMFSSVVSGFAEIAKTIPGKVTAVHDQLQIAKEGKNRAIEQAEKWEGRTKGVAVASTVIMMTPFAVLVPVVLPVAILYTTTKSAKAEAEATRRDVESKSHDETISSLQDCCSRLTILMSKIQALVTWWGRREADLVFIEERVASIENSTNRGTTTSLNPQAVQKGWANVKKHHLEYKIKVQQLLTHHSPQQKN